MFYSKKYILDNGLNLICIKKDSKLISINVAIRVGALLEDKSERGISHFVEHMIFKGTKKRNNEDINSDIEKLGGEYNAYTGYDRTVYTFTGLKEEIECIIEIFSDMLQNSIFSSKEIKKEKEVILSEIRTAKDDIEDFSYQKAYYAAFDKSPLKYDTIGTEDIVNKFTRNEILSFYKKYYIPNNCNIVVASDYEPYYIYKLIKEHFGKWERKEIKKNNILMERNIPGCNYSYKKDIEQSTIIYIFTFNNLNKNQELALRILNHKLGESNNSILFKELREKRGLAYDVYTSLDLSKHVKTMCIYTAVSEENIEKTINIINNCIDKIKKKEIVFDNSTIDIMKKVLKTATAFTLEDCEDIANYVLYQSINNENIYEFIEDNKALNYIESNHIYEIANLVLNNPTIHILKRKE
ncbi:protease 3 precursor [Clostridium acetireducens DSM 10703]|jgi:predicted Zn-dependent peptidase|uniref:Protease 3 n=1 Tax=Clostridium acetireducens DSM 10703 TaxID=1121290 RepID=A0A1E8EZH1_9CLOT|nr:pitrilysin family protein [Clostridium acetireducens]OFI06106.1 protease 3 precursor [Clostridium acetireducens DSM 10703]